MLLTTVVIILQEVLEAALIISILMLIDWQQGQARRWLYWAFFSGTLCAVIYAANLARVTAWFDYTGQELVNAMLQLGIYLSLLLVIVTSTARIRGSTANATVEASQLTPVIKSVAVCLAFTREGSEVFIYTSAFLGDMDRFLPVFAGTFIGAGIGISVGAILYYWLLSFPAQRADWIGKGMLMLIAGNMLAQSVAQLIQVDLLPSQQPLWDTSDLIEEGSLLGQLLYAVMGYEATPTMLQASAYLGGIALIAGLFIYCQLAKRPSSKERP